ncbi:hypothetical protein [Anaerosoma tenue]|uniref:hypothetical protein n=1 Tax=Anaerosoma tenue TaxID=2933588 RepID=UPI002260B607|nr:hypothetical protein [Anaerosoma tenue]MCK8115918.1 hypothetical protein [Anaerosoma tenue]
MDVIISSEVLWIAPAAAVVAVAIWALVCWRRPDPPIGRQLVGTLLLLLAIGLLVFVVRDAVLTAMSFGSDARFDAMGLAFTLIDNSLGPLVLAAITLVLSGVVLGRPRRRESVGERA